MPDTNAICAICAAPTRRVFSAVLLGRHEVAYLHCASCGFLATEAPHWLEEAYASAIASTDVGLVARNSFMASRLAAALYFAFGVRRGDCIVDMAGGYGLLVRMMRDRGYDCFWQDAHCENLFARSFEYSTLAATGRPVAVVSAIEVMEHLADPLGFVRKALLETGAHTLIFTTELYEGDPPAPGSWWYYSVETGQHIAFYQRRTLETLARLLDMNFISCRGMHILTRHRVNRFALQVATGRLHSLLSAVVGKLLGSRVAEDHRAAVLSLGGTGNNPNE